MPNWKRKGWKKADGKPVKNLELIQQLDRAMQGRKVRFEWVKGHAGHDMNEFADDKARSAALAYQAGRSFDAGPGFPESAGHAREEPEIVSSALPESDPHVSEFQSDTLF